jgi:hypothetical protein
MDKGGDGETEETKISNEINPLKKHKTINEENNFYFVHKLISLY